MVVFVPLAFIDGIQGVFFRALAITMVVSLLTSLLLAVTLTPTLATRFIRAIADVGTAATTRLGGPILRRVVRVYEWAARACDSVVADGRIHRPVLWRPRRACTSS